MIKIIWICICVFVYDYMNMKKNLYIYILSFYMDFFKIGDMDEEGINRERRIKKYYEL